MEKREMLEALIAYYDDGNRSAFGRRVGATPQMVSNWIARGILNYEQLYTNCESLSAEWLLSNGEGEMILGHGDSLPAMPKGLEVENEQLKARVEELKERVEELKAHIADLRGTINQSQKNVV